MFTLNSICGYHSDFVLASKVGNILTVWDLNLYRHFLSFTLPVACLLCWGVMGGQGGWRGEPLLSVPGLGDWTAERWLETVSAASFLVFQLSFEVRMSKISLIQFSPLELLKASRIGLESNVGLVLLQLMFCYGIFPPGLCCSMQFVFVFIRNVSLTIYNTKTFLKRKGLRERTGLGNHTHTHTHTPKTNKTKNNKNS